MTFGGDAIGAEEGEATPAGITVLGVTLTPMILGAIAGVVLVAGAAYLFYILVLPALDQKGKLTADLEKIKNDIQQQEQQVKKLEESKAKQQEALQTKKEVLGLFAQPENINTLSQDLNKQIETSKGQMFKFEPNVSTNPKDTGIIDDDSLGPDANGKIKRQMFAVEMQGTFNQVQSTMRNIERLQPLLLVNNFKAELDDKTLSPILTKDGKIEQLQEPNVKASFQIQIVMPLTKEELDAINAAAEAANPSKPPATPTPPPKH